MSIGASHRGVGAVGAISAGLPSSLRQPKPSPTPTRAEHGSTERGRVRERGRPRNTRPTDAPTFVRFSSVGEQETMDWLDSLGKVENSVETMARDIRLLSQTLSQMNTEYTAMKSAVHETVKDIPLYKDYVQGRFDNIEKVTAERLLDGDQRINDSASFSSELNVKLQQADIQMNSIMDALASFHQNPTQYNMATPQKSQGDDDRQRYDAADGQGVHAPGGIFARPTQQELDQTRARLAAPIPPGITFEPQRYEEYAKTDPHTGNTHTIHVPKSFGGGGAQMGFCESPAPAAQARYAPHGDKAQSPFGDGAWEARRAERDFDINYRFNPQLKVFDESISQYQYWASRAKDHVARCNPRWKEIFDDVVQYPIPIRRHELMETHCDGVCAWTLAVKLELWLADWFNINLYNRRTQLAGGRAEIRRQLCLQFPGGSSALKLGGQARLKDWPKCTNVANLDAHLNSWKACLDEYGQELFAAPSMLRTMLLEILPDEFEAEVLDRPEIIDHEQILAFVKRRPEYKRQQKLAKHARKHGGAMIKAVSYHDSAPAPKESYSSEPAVVPPPPVAPPEYAMMRELINAMKQ